MTTAELTSMVMASVALTGLIVQSVVVMRNARSGKRTERVASWSGLNAALDHDNQIQRARVEVLETQAIVLQREMDGLHRELALARRRIAMLEEQRDDRKAV